MFLQFAIEPLRFPRDIRCGERRDARAREPLGDRDGRSLTAAVLAGSAGPIGESEDLLGLSQVA